MYASNPDLAFHSLLVSNYTFVNDPFLSQVRMQDYFSGVLYIHAIEVECHVWLSYQLDHPLQYSPVGHMCSTDRLHDWDLEEYNISYCCRPFLQRQREDGVKFLGHIEVRSLVDLLFIDHYVVLCLIPPK